MSTIKSLTRPLCQQITQHYKARSQENKLYPRRFPVSGVQVPWSHPYPEYTPTPFTAHGDGTPPNDAKLNPIGRTGITGRSVTILCFSLSHFLTFSLSHFLSSSL